MARHSMVLTSAPIRTPIVGVTRPRFDFQQTLQAHFFLGVPKRRQSESSKRALLAPVFYFALAWLVKSIITDDLGCPVPSARQFGMGTGGGGVEKLVIG